MNHYRVYIAVATLVIGMVILYPIFVGGSSAIPNKNREIVLVDRESGEAFLCSANKPTPHHPKTGKPTLVVGMYCEECQAWKPIGSMELLQVNRTLRQCPIHKTPLLLEGTLPETKIE